MLLVLLNYNFNSKTTEELTVLNIVEKYLRSWPFATEQTLVSPFFKKRPIFSLKTIFFVQKQNILFKKHAFQHWGYE